jgi:hypothetical protein
MRTVASPGADVRLRAVVPLPGGVLVVGDVATKDGITYRGLAAMLAR